MFKYIRSILPAGLLGLMSAGLCVQSQAAPDLTGKVIINEWVQGDDSVEILVTETADLRGMWVCDSNDPLAGEDCLQLSTANLFWSSIPAGTLIVFHDGAGLTEDTDVSDYTVVMDVDTIADASYFEASNTNFKGFSKSSTDDNPRLLDAAQNVVFDWDQGDDASMMAVRASKDEACVYTGSSIAGAADPSNWTVVSGVGSLGETNGGGNDTWVASLRSQLLGKVVINEWGQSDDFVELLVTQPADLRGMWLCDSHDPDLAGGDCCKLSSTDEFWSAIPAGTLIVVTDGSSFASDLDNSDFSLTVNTDNDVTLFDLANFEGFKGGNTSDNPRIMDAGENMVHDWAWNESSAFCAEGFRASEDGECNVYLGDTASTEALANTALWSLVTAGSAGEPNGGINTDWINFMRGVASEDADDPQISASPSSITFDTVTDDTYSTAGVTIANAGEAEILNIAAATITGSDKFSIVSPTIPATVDPGSSIEMVLRFEPDYEAGSYDGMLKLTSDAENDDDSLTTVTLSATATSSGSSYLTNKLIINEWGQNSNGDFVEILAVKDVNLQGLWICDSGGPDSENGMQLSTTNELWANVPAGTLILIHDEDYPDATEDFDSSDFSIVMVASSTASASYCDATNNHFKGFGGSKEEDNPRLFDADLVLVHDWDQDNSADFTGSLRASDSGDADVYTGDDASGVSDAANWNLITTGGTPGNPNGEDNTTWIQGLRYGTETQNAAHGWEIYE